MNDTLGAVAKERDPLLIAARGLVVVAVLSVAGAIILGAVGKENTILASFGGGAIGSLATLIRGGKGP